MAMHMRVSFFAALAALLLMTTHRASADGWQKPPISETVTFFYYEDIEAAAAFYGDLLQLQKTVDESWVKIFRIAATSSVGLVQQGRGFHVVSEEKPVMLSIVTDDVESWYSVLTEAGVVMRKPLPEEDFEPNPSAAPVRAFIAEDPGGYTVEFFSWQEVGPSAEPSSQ